MPRMLFCSGSCHQAREGKTARNLLFALLLSGAVVGLAIGLWFYLRSGGVSLTPNDGPEVSDMALLPPDAQMVSTVRLAELYRMPSVKEAIENWRKRNPDEEDPAIRLSRSTGLNAEEIERLHVVSTDVDKQAGWIVARTEKPINRGRVLSKIKDGAERHHEERRYYVGKNSEGQMTAIHFASPTVLVLADEEGMKRAMTQAAKPVLEGPLKPTIALVETSKYQVIVGLNQEAGIPAAIKNNPLLLQFTKIKVARVVMNVVDFHKVAEVQGVIEMGEDKEARNLVFWLNLIGIRGFRLTYLEPMKARGGEEEKLATNIDKLLRATKLAAKGKEVLLIAKTDVPTVAELLLASEKMLRGAKEPPPAPK